MSEFLSDIKISKQNYPFEHDYVVREPLIFVSSLTKYAITVNPGFTSDGMSPPKFIWWFFNINNNKTLAPVIILDSLYGSKLLHRKEADLIFLDAMLTLNLSKFESNLLFKSASLFGKNYWNSIRENTISHTRKYVTMEKFK